jgi:hypothetical protein
LGVFNDENLASTLAGGIVIVSPENHSCLRRLEASEPIFGILFVADTLISFEHAGAVQKRAG